MSKKRRDEDSKGRILLPVSKRHESELRELMRVLTERGFFPRNGDWKSFIDEALESLVTQIKSAPDFTFKERTDMFKDFYSSRIMGLVPLPLSTLQNIVERNPEVANELLSVYFSLFKHSFMVNGISSVRDYLDSLRRFFITITPLATQNLIIKEDGSCGSFTVFSSVLGKQMVEKVYLPLLRQILNESMVQVRNLKGDNITIEAQFCLPVKE
ncbi:hypothetical protein L3N51_01547 [Metallosphaera sp. J1]|uniref:hypothetical protein n=1 Tax=Metallosphaera javensis (ex Hofmann et al. 2022) TaxID=99938 RepID=UPI001EDCF4B6|nr:hypothetical protein [Metallosphaera javensis (ex Hofmann et al. 2022)]MCG3109257.1 hypothetical protein [Metallosphaera javensis (ex Hofmann et al. 2022)]